MEQDRTLLVGFDLCDDFSQCSCMYHTGAEPESVCISPNQNRFLIPTALCVRETTKEWLIGEEAERVRDRFAGVYVEHLLSKLMKNEEVVIYDKSFSPQNLFERFFRKVFSAIRQRYQNNNILQLFLTVPPFLGGTSKETNEAMLFEKLYEIMQSLGLEKDRVTIISHTTALMYYTVNQKKDLWVNDVALFDYGLQGLSYSHLSFGKKDGKTTVVADRVDFGEEMPYRMRNELSAERLAHVFENIANLSLHKKIITSLFVTGRGFEGDWHAKVLQDLCMGRRVFLGQNLYSKGACYAALEKVRNQGSQFLFLSENMLRASISLRVYHEAETTHLPLVLMGTDWTQAKAELMVILDRTNELEFVVTDAIKRDSVLQIITLDGPIRKERRANRLKIELHFLERNLAIVSIRDVGFGSFVKTNYRIWEQILKL